MFAIVEAGGRQEKVAPGAVVVVDHFEAEAGAEVTFDKVLLVETADGTFVAGTPYVGANVVYKPGPGGHEGELTAWDPAAGKAIWTIKEKYPARYQQLIEQYYKSFSEESEG